jgi:hypothetical protein
MTMDLLSISQTIWRHKLATLPIIALMFIGTFYVVKIKPPVYETTSSYILVNPPAPPSSDEIARHPALATVNANNPYVQYNDLSIVSSLLTQTVTTDPVRSQLVRAGADDRFTVGPSTQYPLGTPIVQITGIAATSSGAVRSATLVGAKFSDVLGKLQAAQGVDPHYWIRAHEVNPPGPATQRVSSKLRTLVAVLVLGIIMLFVTVSVLNAVEQRRSLKRSLDDFSPADRLAISEEGDTVAADQFWQASDLEWEEQQDDKLSPPLPYR